MFYLSNIPKHPELRGIVETAAKISGLRVVLVDGPIPATSGERYSPEWCLDCDCIATMDDADMGPFWDEYDKLRHKLEV